MAKKVEFTERDKFILDNLFDDGNEACLDGVETAWSVEELESLRYKLMRVTGM